MNKGKIHSLSTKNIIGMILMGIFWFLYGLMNCFDGIIFNILSLISIIGVMITLILTINLKFENGDEMAEMHFLKARSKALNALIILLLILSMLGSATRIFGTNLVANWQGYTSMILGFVHIISGYYFWKYEKDGND